MKTFQKCETMSSTLSRPSESVKNYEYKLLLHGLIHSMTEAP